MTGDLAIIGVMWRRDVLRFFREKSRVVGALAQPILFWLIIGAGMAAVFRLPGEAPVPYLQYFFPGVVLMVVLFSAIFSTMSVIEDRHQGFLQAVLVAPGSRAALVMGKSLGASTLALLQAGLFLCLAPAAGFSFSAMSWPLVVGTLLLVSLSLSSLGFLVAWWLDSSQAYHAVMGVILIPLWILSGAMFPAPPDVPWLRTIMEANPLTHAVDALRFGLHGARVPTGLGTCTVALDIGILAAFYAGCLAGAIWICYRRR